VTELAGGGIDLVKATIDGLILGANVEHLTLLGGAGLSGTGNDLANALTGNGGVNLLTGGKGNDTLDGGGGADNLNGGAGNDTYLVDKSTDVVLEDAGGGSKDTVLSADDFQLQVGQEIEVLIFTSDADIVGLGNSFGNTIAMTGAGKANLGGAGGNDILTGAANDDTLDGGGADDFLKGGGGKDLLIGAGGNDKLEGGEGNDTLEGGTGIDILAGGKGDDSYLVDETGDKIVELPNQGFDAVRSLAAVYTLGANAEDLVLLTGALIGTGNATGNTITGNGVSNKLDGAGGNDTLLGKEGIDVLLGGAGNDTLDGGVAADTMTGGAGNDLYLVDSTSDVVMEAAGGGTDHVRSVIGGLFLGANVENLTYLGSGNFVGFGNALANVLVGNDGKNSLFGDKGNDTLDGALGNDTLEGGAGNDTYFVDSFDDVVRDLPAAGKDTVHSATSYQLASDQEIEVLTLSSAGFVVGGGNNFANVITMKGSGESFLIGNGGKDALTGGDGNDTLSGGIDNDTLKGGNGDDTLEGEGGNDSMSGGKGDDHYTIESIGDRVTELPGQGIDTVFSWLGSYTLGANIENLTLNSGGFGGKGNALGNIILGNDFFGNPLDGGGGDDTISGAGGGDTLLGGLGNDSLDGGLGSDMLKGGAGLDVLDGGLGADTMLGELGQDYFVYRLAATTDLPSLGGDTINGFQTGTDRIELTDLLTDFGIDAATAFDGGFVLLTKSGADTLVQFDKDGTSGVSGALTLATVTKAGVAESDVLLDGFAGA
jgi:Ca2+-binding RTX toxin-like protein